MAQAERIEIVDVSLKAFFKAVEDFSGYPEFVTGMKSTTILETKGNQKKVHFDMEMMKRLQYSVWATGNFDEKAGTADLTWKLAESDFFKKNNGSWKLKAMGPQSTQVTYSLDVEFSFMVPGLILKGLISTSLPKAIKDFAARARSKGAA